MDDKYRVYIKILGIFFIFISLILILYTSWDLNSFLEISNIFKKFSIPTSTVMKSQTIFFIIKYLIALSFMVFSIFLLRYKEFGRLGLNVTIIAAIFFLLFSHIIFSSRLEGPMFNNDPSTIDRTPSQLPFAYSLIYSAGLISVFLFLIKEKTKNIFRPAT